MSEMRFSPANVQGSVLRNRLVLKRMFAKFLSYLRASLNYPCHSVELRVFFLLILVSVMKLGAQAGFHTQGDI